MSLDELKDRWTQLEDDGSDDNPLRDEELLEEVRARAAAFDRRIRRRDLRETVAAVAGAIPFVVVLFVGSWLARAGAVVVLLSAALIVRTLHRARGRNDRVPPDRPLVEALRSARARVNAQIELLESLFRWYLAPMGVGLLLVTVGTAGAGWWALAYLLAVSVLCWAIHRLNQRAVRRSLLPRQRELTRQLERLEE